MKNRFVKLTAQEVETLQEGRLRHPQFQFRNRCHCLLLSSQGIEVNELMLIFDVTRITIYNWLNRWDKDGLTGLYNQAGQGRKPILTDADSAQVRERVQENCQQLKEVRTQLKNDLSKDFSNRTLKRFLKSLVQPGGVSVKV